MKHTPIWIKTKRGYDRIPYDKMIQQRNGQWIYRANLNPPTDFIAKHLEYFEYSPALDAWIFMPGKNRLARHLKWADHAWSAALGANTVVLLSNLYQHDYAWAALPTACILTLLTVKYLTKRR